jgi:hypothetical protein
MNLFFKNHKHLTRLPSTFNRFVSSNSSKQPRALFSSFASDLLEPDSWKSMEGLVRCKANYAPLSPISFLERSATVYRDRTSVVYGSLKFTWAETHQRCLKLASALSQLGISRGDVVSLFFCLFFFFSSSGVCPLLSTGCSRSHQYFDSDKDSPSGFFSLFFCI